RLVADRPVRGARPRVLGRRRPRAVEVAVHDDQPSAGPQHADPLVDRRLGMGQRPEHVPRHDEIEAAGRERELPGRPFPEPDRAGTLGGLATRLGDHSGREVDAGHAMTSSSELEGEKAGAAADVERVERASVREDESEDAIPRRALGGRADAMAEIFVEAGRPTIPVGGDLLFEGGSQAAAHGDYTFSMTSIWTPSGASRKQTRRPLFG